MYQTVIFPSLRGCLVAQSSEPLAVQWFEFCRSLLAEITVAVLQ
jgi:hypothetical protein